VTNNDKPSDDGQPDLRLYSLRPLDKKILQLLDEGYYTVQIADTLNYSLNWVSRRIKSLRKRNLVKRVGDTKPVKYKVKVDSVTLNTIIEKDNCGAVGTPQNPLIRIHGSEIAFSNLSNFYEQLNSRKGQLPRLPHFKKF